MLNRKEMAATVKEAADKAGALLLAALGTAAAALLIAAAALVIAVRGARHAG